MQVVIVDGVRVEGVADDYENGNMDNVECKVSIVVGRGRKL